MTGGPTLCERFHAETKYIAGDMDKFQVRVRQDPPKPFKSYQSDQAVSLIGYLPFERHPFTGGPMPEVPEATGLPSLKALARLLYFTNGITGIMPMPDGTRHYLRAAPSAGALYPTEIYLAVHDVPDLADGIYNLDVKNHALIPIWEGHFGNHLLAATGDHGAIAQAQVSIILTGVWERSRWRYQERAYRRILLDTGHVIGNLNCVGPTFGFGVFPVGGFLDRALNSLLFLDDGEEAALAVVALPRLDTLDLDRVPDHTAAPSAASHGAVAAGNDSLLHQLHLAAFLDDAKPMDHPKPDPEVLEIAYLDADETVALDHDMPLWDGGIEGTILARRSTRKFIPAPIALTDLGTILSFAYQPAVPLSDARPSSQQMFDPSLLDTYVIVNSVVGIDSGIYYYAPISHELRLVRAGDYTAACHHICLGQDLGRDAGVVVIHTSDLSKAIGRYGDRGYRYLHMDAGHIGERIGLAAQALELGASGIGGFYDDDITRLLGLADPHGVAYVTTVGRPAEPT